jgi:copper chaperone CopZ
MTKSVIHIPGNEARCGLEKISESVSKIVGVFDTETNHISDTLTVEYDQDRVSLDQIRRTIKEVCNCYIAQSD